MIATTLYLPADVYRKVGVVAEQQKKPKAQVIREAVVKAVERVQPDPLATKKFVDALTKLQFYGGVKDLAKNHDKYTWG